MAISEEDWFKSDWTILKEIETSNGSIRIWEDKLIELPSRELQLSQAVELISKLQKAVEFVRELKDE